MSVKISVIIPVFNAESTIAAAINSVLSQRCIDETEIIVVDDGSCDATKIIINSMSRTHFQIICVDNEYKKGPSGARNTGLLRARGKYIAFLDADDIWLPNHLEEGICFFENINAADVVFFNFQVVDYLTKRIIGDWFLMKKTIKKLKSIEIGMDFHLIVDDIFNALLNESFVHLQSTIIKIEYCKKILFNEDIMRSEDRDFAIKLYLISGARFAIKNIITGIYFRYSESLTSKSIENSLCTICDEIKLYNEYLNKYKLDYSSISTLNTLLFKLNVTASYYYRKLGNYKLAFVCLMKSFKYKVAFSQFFELFKIIVRL